MKELFREFPILTILSIIIIVVFIQLIFNGVSHESKYKCLSGHYETQYYFDVNLNMLMPTDVFVCDKEMLKSEYDSLVRIGKIIEY